jgi:stearoyl-CoA desaturase (delta-9 desaturase)
MSQTVLVKSAVSEEATMKAMLEKPVKIEPIYHIIVLTAFFHFEALRGLYHVVRGDVMWQTLAFSALLYVLTGFGVVAGVHRLWSHRAYKVKFPLRLMLVVFNTMAFQKSIIRWARDHRVHHKYCDTNADPHNVNRGFFFSHIGWLFCKKHPATAEAGKRIDVSDLTSDPLLWFQNKYYFYIMPLLCFAMPALVSHYCWGESLVNGWLVAGNLRFVLFLHATFCINSVAHMWGYKPYDK